MEMTNISEGIEKSKNKQCWNFYAHFIFHFHFHCGVLLPQNQVNHDDMGQAIN